MTFTCHDARSIRGGKIASARKETQYSTALASAIHSALAQASQAAGKSAVEHGIFSCSREG